MRRSPPSCIQNTAGSPTGTRACRRRVARPGLSGDRPSGHLDRRASRTIGSRAPSTATADPVQLLPGRAPTATPGFFLLVERGHQEEAEPPRRRPDRSLHAGLHRPLQRRTDEHVHEQRHGRHLQRQRHLLARQGFIPYFTYATSTYLELGQGSELDQAMVANGTYLQDSNLYEGGVKFRTAAGIFASAAIFQQKRTAVNKESGAIDYFRTKGLEVEARAAVHRKVSFTGAYTWQKPEQLNVPFLLGIPPTLLGLAPEDGTAAASSAWPASSTSRRRCACLASPPTSAASSAPTRSAATPASRSGTTMVVGGECRIRQRRPAARLHGLARVRLRSAGELGHQPGGQQPVQRGVLTSRSSSSGTSSSSRANCAR